MAKLKRWMQTMRSLLRIGGLAFYTMLCMGLGLFILVLPPERRRRANMILIQFWSRLLCLLFGLRIRTEGCALPHQNGFLMVANHMSYFDIIILASVVPGIFLSKSQVRYWPLIGLGATMVGTLFVDRGSKSSRTTIRERARERLEQGQNICIFPEGTTSDGRTLLPFRYGAFEIAMKADRPVLPIALNYNDPETIMWTSGVSFFRHLVRIGRKENIDVRVHIGQLIGPKTYKTSVEMADSAWQQINAALVHFGMRTAAQLATVRWHEYELAANAPENEIVDFMARVTSLLVQVDSSTIPGQRQVCQILTRILEVNGHSSRTLLSPGGHANLIASKGKPPSTSLNRQKSYVILMGNSDVVPTDPQGWEHPPFSGALQNDFIWGRGSIDTKGLLAVYLAAFLTSSKEVPVHFICVADEEKGGVEGANYLVHSQLESLQAKVLLGHGGYGLTDLLGSDTPLFLVNTAEKAIVWLRLSCSMKTPGHSAAPPADYPMHLIMRAVDRATRLESELILLPVTERFLTTLSQKNSVLSHIIHQAIKMPIIGNQLRRPLDNIPLLRAMFRNTIAVTRVIGAEADNALAQQAQAILDCRLLPGIHIDAFINQLHRSIHDDRIHIEVIHTSAPNETALNDENFRKLRSAIEEVMPGATVCPILSPVHTSAGYFRHQGIPCYGIFPALFKQEALNLIHAPNERLHLDQLRQAYQITLNFIQRYGEPS